MTRTRRWLVRALVLTTLSVIMAPGAKAGWRQFHAGPARLGVSADKTISKWNVGRMKILWSRPTGVSKEGINSSPVIADGVVYVGSDDGRLYAFGARRGYARWSRPTGGPIRSSPAVAGGVVFAGSEDGRVYAWGVKAGTQLWKRDLGGPVTAPPLVVNGKVYIGSRGGTFFALKASTGRILWKRRTWAVWDGAAFRDGTVYVESDQGRVFAFVARSGVRRWSTPVWGRGRGTPVVTSDTVYVGTDAGRVYALNRFNGHKRWAGRAVKPSNGFVRCAPAVAGGRIFVSVGLTTTPMDGYVRAFSTSTGRILWTGQMADYSTSSPAVENGLVWLGSFDHQLYAFAAVTGKHVWRSGWQYEGGFFDRGISGSPAIANGRVYIGVRDGRLYSLGLR